MDLENQNLMSSTPKSIPSYTTELAKLIKERRAEGLATEFIYLGPRDLGSLSTDDWIFVCNTITNSTFVKTLYIEFMFRKEWCFLLAEALKDNHSITELALGSVKPNSCKYFAELLKINKTIKILNFLDGSSIEDKGLIFLSDVIDNDNRTLTSLILQGNQIENEGCIRLCNSLKKNTSITHLDLSYNTLEYEAWKSIGDMLKINSTLKVLELIESGFKSEDGCVALVEGLKLNATLTKLNILANGFNRNSTNSLIELIHMNKSITSLSMASDLFEDPQISEQLKEALISNTTIRSLDMSLCPLILNGSHALCEVLKQNRTITDLDLSNNSIGFIGLSKIIEGLHNNTTLTRLNIKSNSISYHESLIGLLQSNFALNKIYYTPTLFDESKVKGEIDKLLQRNIKTQHDQNLNMILAIWSISRRPESLDLFPLEIWLHIFKFIRVPSYDNITYVQIFEQLSLVPLKEQDRDTAFQTTRATIKYLSTETCK